MGSRDWDRHMDRRRVLAAGTAVSLVGLRPAQASVCAGDIGPGLKALADQAAYGQAVPAGVALHVRRGGAVLFEGAAGHAAGLSAAERAAGTALRAMTPDTKMRVASVSKMAATLTAFEVLTQAGIGLIADVRMHWPRLRHPRFPDTPITYAQLLSHCSSLRDPEAYWIAAPGSIDDLLTDEVFAPDTPPGTFFTYCNFNFGVLATLLERISGERFDRLAARTLSRLGLTAGFNWSGVPRAARRAGATLYRAGGQGWQIQTDGPDTLQGEGPLFLGQDDVDLDAYDIGSNGTLFSPQGGLRACVSDMAVLAKAMAQTPALARPVWRYDATRNNGNTEGGLFEASGLGCFLWSAARSPIAGQPMIGHDGEAYGLYSGAWHLPALDAQIGFAITGTPGGPQPPGESHPGYTLWSQSLFDLAAKVLGLGA